MKSRGVGCCSGSDSRAGLKTKYKKSPPLIITLFLVKLGRYSTKFRERGERERERSLRNWIPDRLLELVFTVSATHRFLAVDVLLLTDSCEFLSYASVVMDEGNGEWEEKEQGGEEEEEKEEEEEDVEEESWPPWLKPLLQTTFFTNCDFHGEPNNMYCLDCMNGSLCSSCLVPHKDHHFIQVSSLSLGLFFLLRMPGKRDELGCCVFEDNAISMKVIPLLQMI